MAFEPSRRFLQKAAGLCLIVFALFSLAVALHWLDGVDLRVAAWVNANVGETFLGIPWATWTLIGSATVGTVGVSLAGFLAWRSGAPRTALVIVLVALAGGMLVDGLKSAYGRPYLPHGSYATESGNATTRDCFGDFGCDLVFDGNSTLYCASDMDCDFYERNGTSERRVNLTWTEPDYSVFPTRHGRAYPSGHTMGATLSWGVAILLGTRAVQRRRGFDKWAIALWAVLAFMGGISRIPVQAHWWTDVVGSWLLGGAILALAILIDDGWARRRRPEAATSAAAATTPEPIDSHSMP